MTTGLAIAIFIAVMMRAARVAPARVTPDPNIIQERWAAADEAQQAVIVQGVQLERDNDSAGVPPYRSKMGVLPKDQAEANQLWKRLDAYNQQPDSKKSLNPYAQHYKAFVAKSNAALVKQRRKDGWVLAGWTVGGVSVLATIIFLDVVFFNFAILRFLGASIFLGFICWCVFGLISDAVADGVRRGRE